MERERGSETVEIFGGAYDGAVGVVIGREEVDGKLHTLVRLPDGTVLTVASELPGTGPETPREVGS
jgi:hypothetical protein